MQYAYAAALFVACRERIIAALYERDVPMFKRARLILAFGFLAMSVAVIGTAVHLAQAKPKPTGQDDGGPIAPRLGL